MGCASSKGISGDDGPKFRRPKASRRRMFSSSRREEVGEVNADARVGRDRSSTAWLISNSQRSGATSPPPLVGDSKNEGAGHQSRITVGARPNVLQPGSVVVNMEALEEQNLVISRISDGFNFEHVAAGWPSWLTAVAGDAVKGWLPRRADSFDNFNKIGQGTYSSVYKARDLETGKTVALKKVRFDNTDPESVRFMAREIYILRRLDHPNVVKLEALVTSKMSCDLYLVFEYMEHDISGLVATSCVKFTEPQVKCYMQQLLCGLDHCHGRGVLHRDIKGSNLLIDNNGILKIADFGLATFYNPDQKQELTSRVVTLWYRPPELLLGATEYGVAVDMWSTGCIIAELLAGRPIMPGKTEVEQLHKIFKLCGSPSEEFWRTSKLPHDPAIRGTAASALHSEFFTTKPFACDPSSLPKYPPSKEYDAKLQNEKARRLSKSSNYQV
ncbi:probable serine/threonine-protein kinase At1g09600 isoform X2 [Musa acuminata AAA Group]|uniref:probable serine/threonine-protein kinase At1g09600 isoform X2 n=1 Tax=Musa acuminata AAA Group TaxID=214697 RepID=UPI0031DCF026